MSYWSFVEQLVSGNPEAIAAVVLFGLALGVFCLLIGWLMQAIAVILLLPKFRSAAALRRNSVTRSNSPS
jgi:hypothetical protein